MIEEDNRFDGKTWKCLKCDNDFNLISNNYRCPQCRKKVSLNEVLARASITQCIFQTPRIQPGPFSSKWLGYGCSLTSAGIGYGDATGGSTEYQPCIIKSCPIYQTWKLLENTEG